MDESESITTAQLVDMVDPAPQPPSKPNESQLTPEQLVAKSIAPVNKHYLRPPPPRPSSNDTVSQTTTNAAPAPSPSPLHSQSALLKEKKSKRQLKRERHQVPLSLFQNPNLNDFHLHTYTVYNMYMLIQETRFEIYSRTKNQQKISALS